MERDLPVRGAELSAATIADAPEILVLQRCCWVDEAIANETLDIPALHETLDDVRASLDEWATWCVRLAGRLVGSVRTRREGVSWEVGRLMVAPDLGGQGLGGWLLRFAESGAPDDITSFALHTGARNAKNIGMYERAGYARQATSASIPAAAVALVKGR
jgi:GNAT superfamily N-acetyltransferase